jgi:sporulation protein YqfD
VLLPTRVFFFRVEGNGELPERYILEQAAKCGVSFGVARRELRSEQVKNQLLKAIPELRWAGVNTQGCTAVITVALRDPGENREEDLPGDIVAVDDGLVTACYPAAGTAMVAPGQAIREGQVLISGVTDLGRITHLGRAQGEVYGLTKRTLEAVLPGKTLLKQSTGQTIRKFSLLIGKKYVNFSNDSGIFMGSCVRMRTVNYLTLPGGFSLPAALVTDTYFSCETTEAPREDWGPLEDAARRIIRERMTAGVILSQRLHQEGNTLSAQFECRELLGVFRPGVYMERDSNERENRER